MKTNLTPKQNRSRTKKNSTSKVISRDDFLKECCRRVSPGVYVISEIYETYLYVQQNRIACGYCWVSINDLYNSEELIPTKNGQTSIGDIKGRIGSYETTYDIIVWDIIEDDCFKNSGFDQKLNSEIEKDYSKDHKIKVDNRPGTRSKEIVSVPRQLLNEFGKLKRQTLGKMLNKNFSQKTFHPNAYQKECLKKLAKSDLHFFLLDCVMRFGKSFIYLEHLKQEYVDRGKKTIHTVFCHDTKTVDGWFKKIESYYPGLFDCFKLKNKKSFDFTQKVEKNTIVFISQQLLHSNKNLSNPNKTSTQTLKNLIKLNVKCNNTFVDECHHYFTPEWKSYFESITSDRIILASGTAANIKLKHTDLFDESNTYSFTLADLKKWYQDNGILINSKILRINPVNFGTKLLNTSNLQSINENGQLLNPGPANDFLHEFFKGYRTSPLSREKIFPDKPINCPMLVDTVVFARLIYQYLIDNPQLNIVPIMAAGSMGRTVKNETELKDFIKKQNDEGKSTLMISCGSMIQGISVEEWKDVINLSSDGTYESFYQLFGRPWEIDLKKMRGQEINITMWDYNPHRTLKIGAQFVESLYVTNGLDINSGFKHYFEIHDIWDHVPAGNSFTKIDNHIIETEIRSLIDPQVANRGCKARLVTNTRLDVLLNMPDELIDLFAKTQGIEQNHIKVKELKSYKNNIDKQKTNYTQNTHNSEAQKTPKIIIDAHQSIIDGLSVFTERFPIVIECMYKNGIIKEKNAIELLKMYDHDLFLKGFQFPDKKIAEYFSKYILQNGFLNKINLLVDNSISMIPSLGEILNMNEDEVLSRLDSYDKLFVYGGDDTQITGRMLFESSMKNEILSKIDPNKNQNVIIKYPKSGSINLLIAYFLKKEYNMSEEQIKKYITYEEENIFFDSIIKSMGFNKNTKKGKDFIVMNPPYKSGLHIDIFNKAFEELNEGGVLICLHPSTPFINRKPTKDDGKTKKIKEIVSKYKTRLTLVDGNKIFNAGFFTPLSITRVEKVLDEKIEVVYSHIDTTNREVKVYDKLDDIFIHGNDIVIGIYNKIIPNIKLSLENMLYRNGNVSTKYIKLARISGHPPKPGETIINPDFFQLIYKANEKDVNSIITTTPIGKRADGNQFNELVIKDTDNVNYIHSYLMTKFSRFCLSLYKNSANILSDLGAVPYMDFSQEWTDETLFKEFSLDDIEIEFINNYIPNWYERDFN